MKEGRKEDRQEEREEIHKWKNKGEQQKLPLDLIDKDIKITVLDMSKELQQTIAKELNENMKPCLFI